jgi:hypothetical protein
VTLATSSASGEPSSLTMVELNPDWTTTLGGMFVLQSIHCIWETALPLVGAADESEKERAKLVAATACAAAELTRIVLVGSAQ